jgi:tetratricopeptide (TPR) repeat protein
MENDLKRLKAEIKGSASSGINQPDLQRIDNLSRRDFLRVMRNVGLVTLALSLPELSMSTNADSTDISTAKNYHDRAVKLFNSGRIKEAVAEFQKAISIDSNYAEAHNDLGVALARLSKPEQAMVEFQKAISIDPNYTEAHSNLGLTLIELGKLKEAVAEFQKAISINPNFADAYSNLAIVYFGLDKFDEAIRVLQKAISIKPNDVVIRTNLASAYIRLGKLEQAITEFQKAINIDPNDAEVYYGLGTALDLSSKLKEAVAEFQKAISINPNHFGAHNNLGSVYNRLSKFEEAVAEFQKAISINPNEAHTYSNLGIAYFRLEKFEEAIRVLKRAVSINPNDARTYLFLGLAFSEPSTLHNRNEAIKNIEKALSLQPNILNNAPQDIREKVELFIKSSGSSIKSASSAVEATKNTGSELEGINQEIQRLEKQIAEFRELNGKDDEKINLTKEEISYLEKHRSLQKPGQVYYLKLDLSKLIEGTVKRNNNIQSLSERLQGLKEKAAKLSFGLAVKMDEPAASSAVESKAPEKLGAIDFRAMNMSIQPIGSFAGLNFKLPQLTEVQLKQINIESEIQQVKNLIESGTVPSGDRIKELVAACSQNGEISAYADNLLLCLADICKLQEENAFEASKELKEALVIVDSMAGKA